MVDKNGQYIKSYVKPVLSQVTPHFECDQLCLDAPGKETLKLNRQLDANEYKDLRYSDLLSYIKSGHFLTAFHAILTYSCSPRPKSIYQISCNKYLNICHDHADSDAGLLTKTFC